MIRFNTCTIDVITYMFYCTTINLCTYLVQGNILTWYRLVQRVPLCVPIRLSESI